MDRESDLPPSPCVRRCCLDAEDVCVGCGRHLDEILAWHDADAAVRHAILQRAAERLRIRTKLASASPAYPTDRSHPQ